MPANCPVQPNTFILECPEFTANEPHTSTENCVKANTRACVKTLDPKVGWICARTGISALRDEDFVVPADLRDLEMQKQHGRDLPPENSAIENWTRNMKERTDE
jgi:hypothetical protein